MRIDADRIDALLVFARDPLSLRGAKEIAGSIVNSSRVNMHNARAAKLSCPLDFAGVYVSVREEVFDLSARETLETDSGRAADRL